MRPQLSLSKQIVVGGQLDSTQNPEAVIGESHQYITHLQVLSEVQCTFRLTHPKKKQSIGEDMIDRLSGRDNLDRIIHQGPMQMPGEQLSLPQLAIRCPVLLSVVGPPGILKYQAVLEEDSQ